MVVGTRLCVTGDFSADWHAANGEVADVPAEVEVPSVYVPEMDDSGLLLEKEVYWTQDVGSVNLRPTEAWVQYQSELIAIKVSVPRTSFQVVKISCELLSANVARGTPLGQAESREREAQTVREAGHAKFAKANIYANKLVELRKW